MFLISRWVGEDRPLYTTAPPMQGLSALHSVIGGQAAIKIHKEISLKSGSKGRQSIRRCLFRKLNCILLKRESENPALAEILPAAELLKLLESISVRGTRAPEEFDRFALI